MAYRDIRIAELGNRLAFRFDPDRDVIEVMINRQLVEVWLDEYRQPWRRAEERRADRAVGLQESDH